MKPNVLLILTTALLVGGEALKAGTLVEVSDAEAKEFLRRGKARFPEDGEVAEDATVVCSADAADASPGLHPHVEAFSGNDDAEADAADAAASQS